LRSLLKPAGDIIFFIINTGKNMIAFKRPFLLCVLWVPITAAGDQDAGPKLAFAPQEQITVVASRIAMPVREVGASVSVMDQQELEIKNYPALSDALRTLPGVQVSRNGGLGASTSLRIRGEEAHRTRLLIDGINVSDPSTTQTAPNFAHLANSQWGRVEVLRGPQGMIYGADAGGVVSVSSKTTDKAFAADLALEGGEFGTQRVNGNVRGSPGRFDYSLTVSDVSSDGFNTRDSDPTADKDGYDNTTVPWKSGLKTGDNTGIGLVLRDVDAEQEFDGCAFSPTGYDCLGRFGQQSARADWHYENSTQRHEIAYSRTDTERRNTALDRAMDTLDSAGELGQWQYLGHSELAEDLSLVYGVDQKSETYEDRLDNEQFERDQTGVYGELQSGIGERFFYTAGVRHDDNEDFGEHTSYRLTGAYLVPGDSGDIRFKGSYGTGFRAPSLFELAYNNGPFASPVAPADRAGPFSRRR
jgi:vitamin B12 transporter